MKKSYKALLQKKKRLYQITRAADIETLSFKTPQEYWQFWEKTIFLGAGMLRHRRKG